MILIISYYCIDTIKIFFTSILHIESFWRANSFAFANALAHKVGSILDFRVIVEFNKDWSMEWIILINFSDRYSQSKNLQ